MFVAKQNDAKVPQMGSGRQPSAEEHPMKRAGARGQASGILDKARGEDGKVDLERAAELLQGMPRAGRKQALRQLRRQEGPGVVDAVLAAMKGRPAKEEEQSENESPEEAGQETEGENKEGEEKEGEEEDGEVLEEAPEAGGEKEAEAGSGGGGDKEGASGDKAAPGPSGSKEAAGQATDAVPPTPQAPEAEAEVEEPKLPEGPQLEPVAAPEAPKLSPRPLPGAFASVGQRFLELDAAVDVWAASAKAEVDVRAVEAKSSVRAAQQEAQAVLASEHLVARKTVRQRASRARASLDKDLQKRLSALRAEAEQTKASTLARLEVERTSVFADRDAKLEAVDARFTEEMDKMAEATRRDAAGAREEAAFYAGECMALPASWTIEKLKKLARAKAAQEVGAKVALGIERTGCERMEGMKQARREMNDTLHQEAEHVLEELWRMEEDFVTGVDEQVGAVVELEEQHALSVGEQISARGEEGASALSRAERSHKHALEQRVEQVCAEIDQAAESGRSRIHGMAADARYGLGAYLEELHGELSASPELAAPGAADPAVAALSSDLDTLSTQLSSAFTQAASELGDGILGAAGESAGGIRQAGREAGSAGTNAASEIGSTIRDAVRQETSGLDERSAEASKALSGYEAAWVDRARAMQLGLAARSEQELVAVTGAAATLEQDRTKAVLKSRVEQGAEMKKQAKIAGDKVRSPFADAIAIAVGVVFALGAIAACLLLIPMGPVGLAIMGCVVGVVGEILEDLVRWAMKDSPSPFTTESLSKSCRRYLAAGVMGAFTGGASSVLKGPAAKLVRSTLAKRPFAQKLLSSKAFQAASQSGVVNSVFERPVISESLDLVVTAGTKQAVDAGVGGEGFDPAEAGLDLIPGHGGLKKATLTYAEH